MYLNIIFMYIQTFYLFISIASKITSCTLNINCLAVPKGVSYIQIHILHIIRTLYVYIYIIYTLSIYIYTIYYILYVLSLSIHTVLLYIQVHLPRLKSQLPYIV